MSRTLFVKGLLKTVSRAALGGVLLLLGAAPGRVSARPPAGYRALAAKPGPTTVRRAGRRPLTRQRQVVTDQDVLDQAQMAYIRGERQHAIDLAASIADKGGDLAVPAWRFIGLAACSVRASRLASRAYSNLATADDQQALLQACQSNGLIFVNNQFVDR